MIMMEKKSSRITNDHDHDHDLDETRATAQGDSNWDNFNFLLEIAESETKLNILATLSIRISNADDKIDFFTFCEGQRSVRKMKICTSDDALPLEKLPPDKTDFTFCKGKRSARNKKNSVDALLFKKFPVFGVTAKELKEEDNDRGVLFSCGNVSNKPKRLRCPNEEGCSSDQEDEMPPRIMRAKKAQIYLDWQSAVPTNVPDEFKNRIVGLGGSETSIIFVFQKKLTATDVNRKEQRLLVPFKQIKNEFLRDEEKACFRNPNQRFEIDAILVEPSLDQSRINLRQWEMRKPNTGKVTYNYALVTYWYRAVQKNSLREGHVVHLWAFRRNAELGFALVKVN